MVLLAAFYDIVFSTEVLMTKDNLRQIANLLSVLLALTVNILATALPLNNQTTAQISDRFKVFFVPAGYVFAIWGIIYIGWIAFTVYQFLPAHKESPRLRGLGYLFALTGVFNAAWLFCWQYNHFTLSVIVMLPSVTDIETREIMNHELVHIRQKHWFDLLLVEMLCMIQWFNPLVWIYSQFIGRTMNILPMRWRCSEHPIRQFTGQFFKPDCRRSCCQSDKLFQLLT